LQALEEPRKKWGTTYALAVNTWERNRERIRTMFRFTDEVRTLIYTTNPMESFNRQLRKVTKNRSLFPDDTSVLKLLYLATHEVLNGQSRQGIGVRYWHSFPSILRGGLQNTYECWVEEVYTKLLTDLFTTGFAF